MPHPVLYPAIDIKGGRCVRLEEGDFDRVTEYADDPVRQAEIWADLGARFVHVVDLDGAVGGRPANFDRIVQIGRRLHTRGVPIQVGGGIRQARVAADYLESGVERIILGTLALNDPDAARGLAARYRGRVVLGLDLKEGRPAADGWKRTTAGTAASVLEGAGEAGFAAAIVTDIARDGLLNGPNLELYRDLVPTSPIPIIASGGVSGISDLADLAAIPVAGAVVGKALYEGRFTLPEALAAFAADAADAAE